MISVWQIVAFLTTTTSSLAAMQDNIPEHEIISAQAPLETIISNLSRLNDIQLAILKDNLYAKCSINPHNANTIGSKLRTSFTIVEKVKQLETMNYRPRNATVNGSSKKRISIVQYPDRESKKPDYLAWYKENPLIWQSTEFARYVPQPGTAYRAIQTNNDGSLVAVGYGDNTPPHQWGNQVDIIDAHNPACIKKVITIVMPHTENVLNMRFTKNDTVLLTRTENNLYAWDLRGVLMERFAIDGAAQVIQNKECSTKELAHALLSLEKSTQKMKNHYQKKQPETSSDNSDQAQNTDKIAKITPAKRDRSTSLARLHLRLIITAVLLFTMFPQPVG